MFHLKGTEIGEAKISVYCSKKDGSKANLGLWTLNIIEKPLPEIYIGGIPSGHLIDIEKLNIECKFRTDYYIEEKYTIENLTLVYGKTELKSNTKEFSKEQIDVLKKLKKNTLFEIVVVAKSSDGGTIETSGIFKR